MLLDKSIGEIDVRSNQWSLLERLYACIWKGLKEKIDKRYIIYYIHLTMQGMWPKKKTKNKVSKYQ